MKCIGVKPTEIWSCKSPSLRSSVEIFETFERVFLTLSFFKVGELYSSKSTAPILLKFDTLFLHINYEVTLSIFFDNYNFFYNNKISDYFNEKSVFWLLSVTKNLKINKKKTRRRYLKALTYHVMKSFWVFYFKWSSNELCGSPKRNFFLRRLRRFAVIGSFLHNY